MIYFNLDLGPLAVMAKEFIPTVNQVLQDAARDLSVQTHAHIIEQVQAKLHSTRQKYLDALDMGQVDENTWVISLKKDAMFIEEGLKPNTDMLAGLLKSSKAKTAKDGSRYMVVPFEHKKGETSQTPAQKSLTETIRKELKNRNIPYGDLERHSDGSFKKGLLHSFDILHSPPKTSAGAGQGHGAVGAPRQGNTGIPFLQGVRIYQNTVKGKDGKDTTQKSIMTFRVASSKHRGTGKWIHPGLEAKKFLDEAAKWAQDQFESHIKDKILISVSQRF